MRLGSCVLRKELLVTARQPRLFALRAAFVGVLLLALWGAVGRAVPGTPPAVLAARVLRYLGMAQFWAVAVIVPGMCAAAITAERDRRTLPLLLISHLHPASIIVDKVIVRLLLVLLLVAAGAPVLLVLLRFGGVTVAGLAGVYGATASGLLMAAAAGLLGGTVCRRLPVALLASYLLLLVTWTLPLLPVWVIARPSSVALHPSALAVCSPPYALAQALANDHDFWPYGCGLATVVFGAVLAWCCRRLPRHLAGDDGGSRNWFQALYERYHHLFTEEGHLGRRARRLARRHLVDDDMQGDPVLWRESRVRFFVSHTFIFRCTYAVLILLMLFFPVVVLTDFPFGFNPAVKEQRLLSGFSVFLMLYVPLLVAYAIMVAASMIAGEREHRTLDVLLSTPLAGRRILAAKLLGLLNPISIFCVVPFVVMVLLNVLFQAVGFRAIPMTNLCQVFVLCYILGLTAGLVGLRCSARRQRVDTAMLDAALLFGAGVALVLLVVGVSGGLPVSHADAQELIFQQLRLRGSQLLPATREPSLIALANGMVLAARTLWIFIAVAGTVGLVLVVQLHRHVDRLLGRL